MTDTLAESSELIAALEDILANAKIHTPYFTPVPRLDVIAASSFETCKANVIECLRRHPKWKTRRVIPKPPHDGTFVIAAYGPSLAQTYTGIANEILAGHTICTVSGAHDYLLEHGMVPDFHADFDARERKAEFVRNAHDDITYLMASTCPPKTWDYLKGKKVRIWHAGDCGSMDQFMAQREPTAIMHPSTRCIGLSAIVLGSSLGYRKFSIYGMDFSYANGIAHPGWHNGTNDDERRVQVMIGDKPFTTRVEWFQYARDFIHDMLPIMKGTRFSFHGDGMLQAMIRSVKDHKEKAA